MRADHPATSVDQTRLLPAKHEASGGSSPTPSAAYDIPVESIRRPELVDEGFARFDCVLPPGSAANAVTEADDVYEPEEASCTAAFQRSLSYLYLWSNVLYLIYAVVLILIDENPLHWDSNAINNMYIFSALMHVVSAFLYYWVWRREGYPWLHWLLIPDYLNIIEASIFFATSILYRYEDADTYEDHITHLVQKLETCAAVVELMAAFLWCVQWFLTYRRIPGRGWTLDDPDIWANISIVVPSFIYVKYYRDILAHPTEYGLNLDYRKADWMYLFNAIMYFIASLRDMGWFYWAPTAGRFPAEARWFLRRARNAKGHEKGGRVSVSVVPPTKYGAMDSQSQILTDPEVF